MTRPLQFLAVAFFVLLFSDSSFAQGVCGDGNVEPQFGEQCDDGNTTDGDGCSSSCQIEFCGDGHVQPGLGEQCDDGNTTNGDGCSSDCQIEVPVCGDGTVQPDIGEQCDDGNTVDGDGCSSSCQTEFCGDGQVQPGLGEECDDGNTTNGDGCSEFCTSEGPGNLAPTATNDSYSAWQDTPLIVEPPGVLANDIDPESASLTAVLINGPTHGSVILNPEGSFFYTPSAGYRGPDSFSYRANDGVANSNVATVSINIAALQGVGASTRNLTYTRLDQPCRVIDTRIGGGRLENADPRDFRVAGTTGFADQGGNSGGCGVPPEAAAAMINLVAVNPSAAGNLRAAAFPNPIPSVGSIINYQALSPALNIANGVLFPLCDQSGNDCSSAHITLQANGGATHLVADVLGYFRSIPRNTVRSFAFTRHVSSGAAINSTCTNLTSISMTAPTSGRVVVRGNLVVSVPHATGATDSVTASVNADPATCQYDPGESGRSWVDASSPDGTYYPLISIQRSFTVPAGQHTFYINGAIISGANGQTLHSAGIDLSFYPD